MHMVCHIYDVLFSSSTFVSRGFTTATISRDVKLRSFKVFYYENGLLTRFPQ